jgi:hypothetical protein
MESPREDQQLHGWAVCDVVLEEGKGKVRQVQIVVEGALHCSEGVRGSC